MKTILGILLTLVGAAILLTGLILALRDFGGLYNGALADPLGQPDGTEKQVSSSMIRHAIIGAAGIPFLIVGSFFLNVSLFQRLLGRGRGGRRQRSDPRF